MRRRSFLASLAAFFGFGAAAEAEARKASWFWNADAAAADAASRGYDGPLVVPKGTHFRCINGHVACEAVEPIRFGDFNWTNKIGHWRFPVPDVGDQPICPCGAIIVFWRSKYEINR